MELPAEFWVDDGMIIAPPEKPATRCKIVRGPNIKPLPLAEPLAESIRAPVAAQGRRQHHDRRHHAGGGEAPAPAVEHPGDGGARVRAGRPDFAKRAREAGSSIVVGGGNYGQGSSREHAALAPMYLGLKAVLAKSFARIHATNLVNFGILPLLFENEGDYDRIEQGDELEIAGVREAIRQGATVRVRNVTRGSEFMARHNLSPRQVEMLLAGGSLNYVKASRG